MMINNARILGEQQHDSALVSASLFAFDVAIMCVRARTNERVLVRYRKCTRSRQPQTHLELGARSRLRINTQV